MPDVEPCEDAARVVEEVIKRRRSCRYMVPGRLPNDVLERLVEAGTWAPSGSNHQNVRFILLETPKRMSSLGKLKAPKALVARASAGILVLIDGDVPLKQGEESIWRKLWPQNAAASIQNILLLATAMGLASCWVSFLECMSGTRLTSKKAWRALFPEYEIPLTMQVMGLVVLGQAEHHDEQGFPTGDEKHGGRPVARRSVDNYLLCPNRG